MQAAVNAAKKHLRAAYGVLELSMRLLVKTFSLKHQTWASANGSRVEEVPGVESPWYEVYTLSAQRLK